MEFENRSGSSVSEEPVPFKVNRRLYEAIIVLLALNTAYKYNTSEKINDLPQVSEQHIPRQLFYSFVSRLGQICDSRPGGFTVTAFAVLQHADKVEYIFGSNRRESAELESVKGYISSILRSLRDLADCRDEAAFIRHLLRDILTFNRERVRRYLNGIVDATGQCIDICGKDGSKQALNQQGVFQKTQKTALLAKEPDIDDDEFLDRTEDLIEILQSLQNKATAAFVMKMASDDSSRNSEPWREIRHHSSRLLSYTRAVEAFWYTGIMWPDLFSNFEVTYLPSMPPAENPLKTNEQSATEILTRLLTAGEERDQCLQIAQDLQRSVQLNDLIKAAWTSKKLKPIVHAEILVLNWLEGTGGTKPQRFFRGWQFIGSSKPTCKLCDYYFTSHPSGVQARGSHGNLYEKWRMPDSPDVHNLDPKDVQAKRTEITQAIILRLRNDVIRVLTTRVAEKRPHDSATISSLAFPHHIITSGLGSRPPSPSVVPVDGSGEEPPPL